MNHEKDCRKSVLDLLEIRKLFRRLKLVENG